MPKVSVIVPVYNTEKYVERAIVSLMEQTLDDVEFIIIDDGSKDNSIIIIKQVIERYPNRTDQVILISRENRGVAATRAQGMELAKGEYTIHLDSDDWADLDWLNSMYSKAKEEDADIVVCDYQMIFTKKVVSVQQKVEMIGKDCIRNLLIGKISNMNWDKLVRRSLYSDNDINFVGGLDMGEDFLVTFRLLFFAQRVSYVSDFLYYYNKANDCSLTKKYSEKSLNDIVKVVEILDGFVKEHGCLMFYKNEINHLKLNVRAMFIVQSGGDFNTKRKGLELYPETNNLIWKARVSRYFKLTYYLNLLGFDSLNWLVDKIRFQYINFIDTH